jgi:phage FluMu gp28-like protein
VNTVHGLNEPDHGEIDPRMEMDESDYFSFIRSGCADEESFLQEFMCQPADDNTAFLSYDLITSCEYQGSEEWETDLMDCKNPLYVGVDIGREHVMRQFGLQFVKEPLVECVLEVIR